MRCRCPFQDGAVFSAGSNPDFDLCATVRDFHPCFPRPTDWLKYKKDLFEKIRSFQECSSLSGRLLIECISYSNMSICFFQFIKTHCGKFLEFTDPSRARPIERRPHGIHLIAHSTRPRIHAISLHKLHPHTVREKNAHSESWFKRFPRHFLPIF